jgi:glutathione S-transferase
MTDRVLYIGNKAYSSWSLRPWLALTVAGIPFTERLIPFETTEFAAAKGETLPAGRVPVLVDDGLVVWDSLAILEYLAERWPEAGLWPEDRAARAIARSASAEMHAGFAALRAAMPMNVRKDLPGRGHTPDALADAARIAALWADLRARFGGDGPFLCGRFGAVDAMYAPVATRFRTYGVALDAVCAAYVEAILGLPAMQAWYEAAGAEPWVVEDEEVD